MSGKITSASANAIIQVVPYRQEWPALFTQEAARIQTILSDNLLAIHHIGSTAVPGLAAKPVIDIIPVVKNILAVDPRAAAFEALGYQARGEFGMPFRRFFQKLDKTVNYHLHVFEEGNPEIERHLLFRDYLKQHPEIQKEYADLKIKLAHLYRDDRTAYVLGKDDLIRAIDAKTGFSQCRLVQALTPFEWEAYHRIRRDLLFTPMGIVYDPHHWTITAKDHIHFVYRKTDAIVGVAHVQLGLDKQAILRPFAIDIPYQNQGYGTQLLALLERWLQHQGFSLLQLHARPEALNFYRKAGYVTMPFADPERIKAAQDIDLGKFL